MRTFRFRASLPMMTRLLVVTGLVAACGGANTPGAGAPEMRSKGPEAGMLRQVRFDQNLGAQIPLDLKFHDEHGRIVRLGDYYGQRPVIVSLVYYECPMLCGVELNGLMYGLRGLDGSVGEDFDIVTVSIDPKEKPVEAARKKATLLKKYGRKGAENGWHFLTGDKATIQKLADTVGFHFVYNPETKQYAHPAGVVCTTSEGKIARYLFGVDFPPRSLRFALAEASADRIGSPIDALLLLCYHYDPATGKYSFAIMGALRLFGLATVAGLGTFMLVMIRRDRHKGAGTDSPGLEPGAGPASDDDLRS